MSEHTALQEDVRELRDRAETAEAHLAYIRRVLASGKIVADTAIEASGDVGVPSFGQTMVLTEILSKVMDGIGNRLRLGDDDHPEDMATAEQVWDRIPDEFSIRDLLDLLDQELARP